MSTEKIKNVVGFGKDTDSEAQPIGIAGEDNNELMTLSLEELMLFQKILMELKKFNMHLDIITNSKLTYKDAESYRDKMGE
jgi:hypothetical protein